MRVLVILVVLSAARAVSAGEPPKVEGLSLDGATCDHPTELLVRGRHLVTGKDVRVQLWQGTPKQLVRGLGLVNARNDPQGLRVTVPAGGSPGSYRLVVIAPDGTDFSEHTFEIREPAEGPVEVASVESFLMTAGWQVPPFPRGASPVLPDHPTRIALVGAHLDRLEAAWLQGPGKIELRDLTRQHSCRLLATVPGSVEPGEYKLVLGTDGRTVETSARIAVLTEGSGEAGWTFLILFGVLGLVYVAGLVLAWKAGQVGFRTVVARRNLALQVGGLLFYLVLLGFFQFVLADWIG